MHMHMQSRACHTYGAHPGDQSFFVNFANGTLILFPDDVPWQVTVNLLPADTIYFTFGFAHTQQDPPPHETRAPGVRPAADADVGAGEVRPDDGPLKGLNGAGVGSGEAERADGKQKTKVGRGPGGVGHEGLRGCVGVQLGAFSADDGRDVDHDDEADDHDHGVDENTVRHHDPADLGTTYAARTALYVLPGAWPHPRDWCMGGDGRAWVRSNSQNRHQALPPTSM